MKEDITYGDIPDEFRGESHIMSKLYGFDCVTKDLMYGESLP